MRDYFRYTFLSGGRGFHFSAPPPPDLRTARYLASRDAEEVLCAVLAFAQVGDFRHFDVLTQLMKRERNADVWGACAMLFAYAAPYSAIRRLLDEFSDELYQQADPVVGQWVTEILSGSKGLWTVSEILRLLRLNRRRGEYFSAPRYLSFLLEEERDEIAQGPPLLPRLPEDPDWWDPPPRYDDDAYETLVLARCSMVAMRTSGSETAIFEGEPLSLERVAARTLARTRAGADIEEVAIGRMILEANTGRDASSIYTDGRLRPLSASAFLEELLEDPSLSDFEPGQRYFFRHRIPD